MIGLHQAGSGLYHHCIIGHAHTPTHTSSGLQHHRTYKILCVLLSDDSNVRIASCSAVQGDVLTAMHSLVHCALVAWTAEDDATPDQHYQALLLRAISIVLLNPWIDDDQTGRRCPSPVPCLFSHSKACRSYNGTAIETTA